MSAVTATDVLVRYGSLVALGMSTFSIPTGGVTALIGPNGSGKSTVLNIISGLVVPQEGSLVVGPIDGGPRRVSYVLQGTKVSEALPLSVREVVTMGRYASTGFPRRLSAEDRQAIERAMTRTGITDLANRHLHGLSGGQRQRVFIAQGLAQGHDVLLLDEPMTGLDIPSIQAISEIIAEERNEGCSIVMTTHSLAEAQVADHVILLSGRVVTEGPPGDVLTVEHLTDAYGSSVLRVAGDQLFFDDPHHSPTGDPHQHREPKGLSPSSS
jgi:iron complex transport system ATP-binding protein